MVALATQHPVPFFYGTIIPHIFKNYPMLTFHVWFQSYESEVCFSAWDISTPNRPGHRDWFWDRHTAPAGPIKINPGACSRAATWCVLSCPLDTNMGTFKGFSYCQLSCYFGQLETEVNMVESRPRKWRKIWASWIKPQLNSGLPRNVCPPKFSILLKPVWVRFPVIWYWKSILTDIMLKFFFQKLSP